MRLLNISSNKDINLKLEDIIGKFIAILGIRGSGKTNTSAVLLEEILKYNLPLTIVDIDGEYWGLKEKFEILVVGKSENVDVEIEPEHAEYVAEISISKDIPVILDVSGFLYDEIYDLLLKYFKKIWDLAGKYRKPYEIILEEAHEFIPQSIKTELKEILVRIALRGRKRGLGAIIISQRSAKVEKDVLTQAEILFLHKVVHPADLKIYKEVLPLSPKDVTKLVTSLNVGECIFYYGTICKPIRVRLRETFHAGYTPTLKDIKKPKLKMINEDIIKYLKEKTALKRKEKNKINKLKKEIEKLKIELAKKEEIIKKLHEEIELLRKIKIKVEPTILTNINDNNNVKIIKNKFVFENLPYNVKERAKAILNRINSMPRTKKEILKFLIIREPEEYTYNQISEWTGYSLNTIYSNNLRDLIKLGLVEKEKIGNKYYFRSNFRNFIRKEFKIYYSQIGEKGLKLIEEYIKSNILS